MPGGRPSKYDPKYCEMLIEHMKKGLSYETFGPSINVATSTIYLWEKDHPQFSEAKRLAFDHCRLFWEEQGTKGLWSEDKGRKLNSTVWIFNMKNRFGWKDKNEIDLTVTDTIPFDEDDEQLS